MKNILRDWWPLAAIAAFLLVRRMNRKTAAGGGGQDGPQTVKLHGGALYTVPDLCPVCQSPVDHAPGNKSLTAKCTRKDCSYSVCYPMEGQDAGMCNFCGSTRRYRVVLSSSDGASVVNRAVCDNPDCKSQGLVY